MSWHQMSTLGNLTCGICVQQSSQVFTSLLFANYDFINYNEEKKFFSLCFWRWNWNSRLRRSFSLFSLVKCEECRSWTVRKFESGCDNFHILVQLELKTMVIWLSLICLSGKSGYGFSESLLIGMCIVFILSSSGVL